MSKYFYLMICFTTFLVFIACEPGCTTTAQQNNNSSFPAGQISTIMIPDSLTAPSKDIAVDIYIPRNTGIRGDILVLPGWKFSRERWHQETDLRAFAEKYGYRLVFPDMMESCYETRYYRETTMKWAATPGGQWIKEVFIPHMQTKYNMLTKGNNNYLLGLSTGARGVAIIALEVPDLFAAGAALSGDYNQPQNPQDQLITAIYGYFALNKTRWYTVDNPSSRARDWKMPIYLGHGSADTICAPFYTESFHQTLKKVNPDMDAILHLAPGMGHDFTYWNSELPAVFDYFNKHD